MTNSEGLPTDPNQYNVFLLYTGYVESNAASPVIISMSRNHQFPEAATWQEAWGIAFSSMRKVFLDILQHEEGFEDGSVVLRPCCEKALSKKKVPRFCEDCGEKLSDLQRRKFPEDPEERLLLVYDFLVRIRNSTNDSLGGEIWEFTDSQGWVIPGHIDPGYVTFIHSHAEDLLANYEEEKETYKWNKDLQFWGDSTVDIARLVSPRDKVIFTANDSVGCSTSKSAENDS